MVNAVDSNVGNPRDISATKLSESAARNELARLSAHSLYTDPATDDAHSPPRLTKLVTEALRQQRLGLNFQAMLYFDDLDRRSVEVQASLATENLNLSSEQLALAAEQNHLGEALDRAVLLQTARFLRAIESTQKTGRDSQLKRGGSKNKQLKMKELPQELIMSLSSASVLSRRFIPWLQKFLSKYPELAKGMVMQISEPVLLVARQQSISFASALEAIGVSLRISHFGVTECSLELLRGLSAQSVKLDASLIRELKEDSLYAGSTHPIVEQLHSKGLQISVGDLDKLTLLPLLWHKGIDAVQGDCILACGERPEFPHVERRKLKARPRQDPIPRQPPDRQSKRVADHTN